MNGWKICTFVSTDNCRITNSILEQTSHIIEDLVAHNDYGIFIFCRLNDFANMCWNVVTRLQQRYPHLKRIYYMSLPCNMLDQFLANKHFEEVIRYRHTSTPNLDDLLYQLTMQSNCVICHNAQFSAEISNMIRIKNIQLINISDKKDTRY